MVMRDRIRNVTDSAKKMNKELDKAMKELQEASFEGIDNVRDLGQLLQKTYTELFKASTELFKCFKFKNITGGKEN
jgi:hypothetical protein